MNIPVKSTSPTGTSKAPTAPWDVKSKADGSADLARKALLGAKFIRESNISLDLPGASQDYKKLFTLYQALNTLQGIVERAQEKNVSATSMRTLERVFAKGMNEIQEYLDKTSLDHVGLIQGQLTERLKSTTGVPRANPTYVGKPVHQGAVTDSVKAFEGDVKFTVRIDPPVAGIYEPKIIEVNLADMEAGVNRSMGNVTAFINEKLKEQGVSTRFAVERTPAVPRTATVNGKEVVIDKGKDSFALKVNGSTTEILSFSAEKMSDSVYVVQTSGDTDNDNKNKPETLNDLSRQILKFQADISDTQASVTRSGVGDTYWVEGRSAQSTLEDSIKAVHQTVSGPDGSVYVLANVDGEIDGQGIKGAQDVALIKYDSAGNVVYTRTLGAVDTASGYAMAISDDGRVAITGSVKGQLTTETKYSFTTDSGAVYSQNSYNYSKGYDKSVTDSFVTVFDASGVEEWTQRRGSIGQDEGLSVTFGEDGSVYVGGRAQGVMTGASEGSQGGWDAYVMSYGADGSYQATTQFGTTGADAVSAMTVEGSNLYVASNENGQAVLHRYDLSSGQPVLADSRNLGHLGGGSISSISVHDNKVYLGGSADITSTGGQPALMSGATVSSAHNGGFDAFALSVSTDFAQTTNDTVAYYGSDKSERDAKVTFSEGQAWIAFQTTGEVAGTKKL
ncbi:MAG: transcriptional regulator, partial [Asticcacaulis sp.]